MKRFFHIFVIYSLIIACFVGLCGCTMIESDSVFAAGDNSNAETSDPDDAASDETSSQPTGYETPVTMYYQTDPAYRDYLYGGHDPMSAYGCGPTALSIAVSSLSENKITPIDAAVWSADNGYYSRGHGTAHGLIPNGSKNFGLSVENLTPLTPDTMRLCLSSGKLIVLLMGPGDFTDSGHFIIAHGYDANGNIMIADPASPDRSKRTWPAELLISQLSKNAHDGGPVWVISK